MDPSLRLCIQFFIVAACVFALVKAINQLKREEARNRRRNESEALLEEIRDLLKEGPRGLSGSATRLGGGGLIFSAFAARLPACRLWLLVF